MISKLFAECLALGSGGRSRGASGPAFFDAQKKLQPVALRGDNGW